MNLDFSKVSVLIIGDSMLDEYCYGDVLRNSPEADIPVLSNVKTERKLGGAANVAMNIMAMGANATLLSVIGKDQPGDRVKEMSSNNKIEHSFIRDSTRRTSVKRRFLNGQKQLLRLDIEDTQSLSESVNALLMKELTDILENKNIDMVILQDYNKGVLNSQNIKDVITICNKAKTKVCVDPKYDNFKLYNQVYLIKPNFKELRAITHDDIKPEAETLNSVLKELGQEMKIKHWYVTLSEKGIHYFNSAENKTCSTVKIDNPDVCGAGDSVMSILALSHAIGMNSSEILGLCNTIGTLACRVKGTSVVDIESIRGHIG